MALAMVLASPRFAGADETATVVARFEAAVDYGQIVVDLEHADRRYALWSSHDETAQGFSWSPGAVAFGVPDRDGTCLIEVRVAPRVVVDDAALWAIRVPFEVPPVAQVEVGTVAYPRPVAVPPERYSLVFQALPGPAPHPLLLRVAFCRDERPAWQILKRGSELTTDVVLVERARRE